MMVSWVVLLGCNMDDVICGVCPTEKKAARLADKVAENPKPYLDQWEKNHAPTSEISCIKIANFGDDELFNIELYYDFKMYGPSEDVKVKQKVKQDELTLFKD